MVEKLSPESLISVYSVNTQLEIINSRISKMTMDRYSKWLVSQKYIINNHDVDEMLSNVGMNNEYTIFEEKDRISGNQRILLEIEKSKFNQRKVQADEERMTLRKVTNRVAVSVEKKLTEKMIKFPINKLIWGFPDFGYYSSFAYSASLNFSKLGSMTTLSKPLSSNILELANNSHFCSLLGRTVKPTNDPKAAIGYIGIENCRRLFPLLMAKPLLRLSDKNTSIMTPKIWQHSVLTANTARIRLEQSGYKEPDEGIFLGVIRTLSYYVLSNYFTQVFEDVQLDIMIDYRKKKLMKEYYACFNVKPTLNVLPNLMLKLEKMIAQRIVENIEWDPKAKHLRKALVEDIQEKPVSERSLHGVALAQARAFSIYNMMDKSNVFVEKHTPYWFYHVRMDMNTVSLIEQEKPQKLSIA